MKIVYLAENIKWLRTMNGLTQDELAYRVSVNKSAISNYETNQRLPERDVLIELAHFFNITIDELLYVDVQMVNQYVYKRPTNLNLLRKDDMNKLETLMISMIDEQINGLTIEINTLIKREIRKIYSVINYME